MVCPVCLATPLVILLFRKIGISDYVTTTLMGVFAYAMAFQTNKFLLRLSEKKRGISKNYIPFQFIIILTIYLLLVFLSYNLFSIANAGECKI